MSDQRPVSVTLVGDCELVRSGLAHLCSAEPRLLVVDPEALRRGEAMVEVVLVDPFARPGVDGALLAELRDNPRVGRLVLFSWAAPAARIEDALAAWAAGYVAKALAADDVRSALLRIAAGEKVVAQAPYPASRTGARSRERGTDLTPREGEVLDLVARGLSNQEIAELLVVSVNSVKSHIRTAYRKIGAASRSQAILWARAQGLGGDAFPAGVGGGTPGTRAG